MPETLNVLLCGTGDNARWHVAESRRAKVPARITHVFGQDPDRTKSFANSHGLTPVIDLDECLSSGRVRAVDVCTINSRHVPLGLKAVAAGLPVLVEKPLGTSLAEATELVETAESAGVPLGILYHKRYAPQHQALKRFIESGSFGPGPLELDMSIHHAADDHYFKQGESWKASVDLNGGGILMNQVIHYLDLLLWWLGPLKYVDAKLELGRILMEGESGADLRLEFEAGHTAHFTANVAVRKALPVYLAAHGRAGSVAFNGMELTNNTIGFEADQAFRIRPIKDRFLGRIPYRFRRKLGWRLSRLDDESAGTGWAEFFSRVAKNVPVLVDGREGLKVLAAIDRIYGPEKPRRQIPAGMLPPRFGQPALDHYHELADKESGLDVLLVNPAMLTDYNRAHAHIHTHRPRPPVGLVSATAMLRAQGFTARTIDAAVHDYDLTTTAELINRFEPRIVVLTTAQADRWQNPDLDITAATELIAKLREYGLGPIILLGPHGSATPAWTIHETKADYVIRGEPERSVLELTEYLTHGGSLESIPGLAWLENNLTRESLPRPFDDDLDEYPFPAYGDLPLQRYQYTSELLPKPYTSVFSSRGCPAKCIFCLKAMMPAKWRAQTAEKVVQEMARLHDEFGIASIYFQDWEFIHDKDRARRVADLIKERGLKMNWGFSARLSNLTEANLLQDLAEAGCKVINGGYETGSQELLNKMKKGVPLKSARTAIENCRRVGIELRLFALVNLPGESFKTIAESMTFLSRTGTEVVHPNLPIPYPTTKLWEMAQAPLGWDGIDKRTGKVGTTLRPRLAVEYFKHLNRNRRFGRGYLLRPRFWRYILVRKGLVR